MMYLGIGTRILDLLFPPRCPVCNRVLERSSFCDACREQLPWTENQAENQTEYSEKIREKIRRYPAGFSCIAPLQYEGSARTAILRYKFQGQSAFAEAFGELLALCIQRCFLEEFEFDQISWVPVSRKRLKTRGYDQTELLTRSVCRHLKSMKNLKNTKEYRRISPEKLLVKYIDTPAQSSLKGFEARQKNVQGVYRAINPAKIQGRQILLIDDICTTGSTLSECVRTLYNAGAAKISCATLAWTTSLEKVPLNIE